VLGMDFFMDTPRCISLQHGKGNTSKYDGNMCSFQRDLMAMSA